MSAAPFADILDAALRRHGKAGVETRLPQPKSAAALAAISDDRFLSDMSRRIFRAGLKHSLADANGPRSRACFTVRSAPHSGDVDEQFESLLGDAQPIRHSATKRGNLISMGRI